MDDLVERLLKKDAWTQQKPYWHHRNPDGPEAAARITALEASLAEVEGRVIAARRQALEEAAKVVDAKWDHWRKEHEKTSEDAALFIAETCESIGIAIRALKDSPPPTQ